MTSQLLVLVTIPQKALTAKVISCGFLVGSCDIRQIHQLMTAPVH